MGKRIKLLSITAYMITVLSIIILGFNSITVNAYSGVETLTERELYNGTNTYDVNSSLFDLNGSFIPTTENDRITNTTQYNVSYNMTTKQNRSVMNYAQITVLTHGLDSNASVWSNNFSALNHTNINFAYDSSSLITKISDQAGGANIYWAKMTGYNNFDLYNITNQTGTYVSTTPYKVESIIDISKHIIIVFEAFGAKNSNNNIYYQFNYMLSKIIYDVKVANGGILPKVNLIGHSRGGITNLQYALDHPDLVSSLISLGTPYFGSTTARLFGETFMGACDGLDDILDAQLYYGYNTRWNSNYYSLYQDINVQTIGSYHTLSNLVEVINNDYSNTIEDWQKVLLDVGLPIINGIKLGTALDPLNLADQLLLKEVGELLQVVFPESSVSAVAAIILSEMDFDANPMFVSWDNDILVPLNSQLGLNSGSLQYGGGNYYGFNTYTRVFASFDDSIDYLKVSQALTPVGHNLEARDKRIITKVISELDLGVNSQSAYITEDNGDGTLTFAMYKGTYPNSQFIIPDSLDGKTITKIAPFAFDGETGITEITIPASVTEIGAYAFAGLDSLTTINFGSGSQSLQTIGYGAFAGCSSLSKFNSLTSGYLNLPVSTTYIDCYAFANTAFAYVNINGNANYIGEAAFANISTLNSITATNSSSYFTNNGVLYSYSGWLLQYPIGNLASAFSVLTANGATNIRFIAPFAFSGGINLTSIAFNNIISIGQYAFVGCSNLISINSVSAVEYVAPFAFYGTGIINASSTFNVVGKVLIHYNGSASILSENDFPTGVNRIASYAFLDNDYIETVKLPLTIYSIDDYAFIDCDNLGEVRYLNTVLPDINKYPFWNNAESFSIYCRKDIIDNLTDENEWYGYIDSCIPVSTSVFFIDLNLCVDFYYGQIVSIPSNTISGYYNRGWKRYDNNLQTSYGDYLTPSLWNETIEQMSFKADLIVLETYSLVFYNGNTNHIVGSFDIHTGDYYQINKYNYTINGVTTQFAGYYEMDNCAYGSYYGSPVVNNVIIATFNGWLLNGSQIYSGQWLDNYSSSGLAIYSDWCPTTFTATLNDNYNNTSDAENFTYFVPLVLPSPTFNGYVFDGWYDGNGIKYTSYYTSPNNIVLTAVYNEIFTVTLISTSHVNYNNFFTGTIGTVIQLPILQSGYYHVDKWGTYDAGSNYTIIGNTTLYAVWKGTEYSITYSNLTFLNQTADVIVGNNLSHYAPTYYEYGVGLDLTNISAFYQSSSPYSPQLRFLGWYTSMNFGTRKTFISQTSTGNVTIYAKWKYDYDYPTRTGTYTINNADPLNQTRYDQISLWLGYDNLYQNLINIGITKLTFTYKLRSWGEGTQHIFVYNQSGTQVASTTFSSTSSATVHTYQFTINLSALGSSNFIYIRYQADSYEEWVFWPFYKETRSRYWYCDYLYMEMSFVVSENDFYDPEFYWHDQDPFG